MGDLAGQEVAVVGGADREPATVVVDHHGQQLVGVDPRRTVQLAAGDPVPDGDVHRCHLHVGHRRRTGRGHQRGIGLMPVADVAAAYRRDHQVTQGHGLPVVGYHPIHWHGGVIVRDIAQPVDDDGGCHIH